MRVRSSTLTLAIAACASFLASLPASAQAIEFGRPNYDLVSVATHILFPSVAQGTANEGSCLVLNTSGAPVKVRLEAAVVYADGSVGRLTGIADPGVLEPDGGFELSVFFIIPADAPVGTAEFSCGIRAQNLITRREMEGEISTTRFEITSP